MPSTRGLATPKTTLPSQLFEPAIIPVEFQFAELDRNVMVHQSLGEFIDWLDCNWLIGNVPSSFSSSSAAVYLTYQYDLRPTAAQYEALERILYQTRVLYNAALQARIGNWEYGKALAAKRGATKPDPKLDVWVPETLYPSFTW